MDHKEIRLTEESINTTVEQLKSFLTGRKVPQKDVLKLGLLIEEALLRLRDRFGRTQKATVMTSGFGGARITIKVKGDAYDPLHENNDDSILKSEYIQNLLDAVSTSTSYRYRNGCNEITARAQSQHRGHRIPGGAISIAVVLAVVAALLSKTLLPAKTLSFLVDDLAAPIFSRLMGMITMVAGPLIFISVVSGICALNDIATLSRIGLKAIRRFVVLSVMMITFSVLFCLLFFSGISSGAGGAFDFSQILGMLLDLIPQDFISPFIENKTIQIILIAIAVGVALLIADEKCPSLRTLVSEINRIIFTIMEFVSRIIPVAVFLSIYKAVAVNSLSSIAGVWKLVVLGYLIIGAFTILMVLRVCLRRKIRIGKFLRDISGPAIVGFTTASGTVAMTKQFDTAINVMKKDEKLVRFWVPLSHAMFSPSVIPPLVAAAFFAGVYYGTPLSLPQILIMYILVTQLSIASPKVPGGIMATFSIMLVQLGMPTDVVGLLMVANVFIVNIQTGLAMVIRSAELEEFSHIVEKKL